MSSFNALFPPLPVQKTAINPSLYHQEREDVATPAITPFISGQCPLDSPRDKCFFSLFQNGWVDRTGQCNPEKTWPDIQPFGSKEHAYIKSILQKPRWVQCVLKEEIHCFGCFNLASLFTHLQKLQQPRAPSSIYLIGSELQEIEHKYDWSFTNLRNLSGIEIPQELIEAIKKRTSSDSDWRFYPGGTVTSEVIQKSSVEIINFFAHCIYWDPRNVNLRADHDKWIAPYYSFSPEWQIMQKAIHDKGLQKFHFYDSISTSDPKNEPKMCYATVGFSDPHSKPVDILLIKELNGNSLFNFDDCQLWATDLIMACHKELMTQISIDTSKMYRLHSQSELSQATGPWQHLIDQFCYFIRSHRPETYTSNAFLRSLAHYTKGGRTSGHPFKKELMEKISLKGLPNLIAEFHKKHPRDLNFRQAYAITTLFSLIESNYSNEELLVFWKEVSTTFTEHTEQNPSLSSLIIHALKQPKISPTLIYRLVHLLSFINLGAPHASKHQFYLHFQEEQAVFETIETYTLSSKGDILETLKEIQSALKDVTSAKSLNCLHKLINHLLPQHPSRRDQETVLKFYTDSLKLDYPKLNGYAQEWLHAEHPMFQILGVHLSFLYLSNMPSNVPSLKEWMFYSVKYPHLKALVSSSLVPALHQTPQQNLKKAVELFANDSSDWVKVFITAADQETIHEVTEIVSNIKGSSDDCLSLFKKIASFDTSKALAYLIKNENTFKDADWIEAIVHISEFLVKIADAELIKKALNLILNKNRSSSNYPLHSTFVHLATQLVDLEGPFAADLILFQAIEQGIAASHMEQIATLCTIIFDGYVLKDAPKALEFWEKSEKKAIWKQLPSTDRNRLILALPDLFHNFPLIQKLDQNTLTSQAIEIVRPRVLEEVAKQIERANFKKANEISKEFATLIRTQDSQSFLLQKGRKHLAIGQWQESLETLKELIKTSNPDIISFVESVLKTFFDNKVPLFVDLLMKPEIGSCLGKTVLLRTLALQYLQQEPRSIPQTIQILVFLLKNLDPQTIQEQDIVELLGHINPVLEQITEPISTELTTLLSEKKSYLIPSSPELTLRFLSGLMCRKISITFPKKIIGSLFTKILRFLQESRECDKVHLLVRTLKQSPVCPEHATLVTELTNMLLEQKDFQKAAEWIPFITDEALLIKGLHAFIENDYIRPIPPIFERLKQAPHLQSQIHPVIELLANKPQASPTQIIGLLMDFAYPVSPIWVQTLDKLRIVKKQEPRFLQALQADQPFLNNFTQAPGIFHDCFVFAIEALGNHGSRQLIEFCRNSSFWSPLTLIMTPNQRVAILEAFLQGLLSYLKTHSDTAEIEDLLWIVDLEREQIFEYNEQQLPPQIPGLGWKKTIMEALIRSGNTEVQKIVQPVISKIETDQLTPECIRDVESLALFALKKETGLEFLQLFLSYPLRFLSQINLENLFNALNHQKSVAAMEKGFHLIYHVLATVEEKNIDQKTQAAILNFAAKATVAGSPRIDVYSTLIHKQFNVLTRFKAELFTQLFSVQAVQIAQSEDPNAVPKTLSCLLLRFKNLSRFPEGEKQCIENAFSLLLMYLGWSKNRIEFDFYYLKLIDAGCNLLNEAPVDNSSNCQSTTVENCDWNKFFHLTTYMISTALKITYSDQLINDYLMDFVWSQLLKLCQFCPKKHHEILPLMEKALFTPWIGEEPIPEYYKYIQDCLEICFKNIGMDIKPDVLFRFSLYQNGMIEPQILIALNLDTVVMVTIVISVVMKLIETKNSYQISLAVFLLKNLHRFTVNQSLMPYLEKHPEKMTPIYELIMDAVSKDPFFHIATPIMEENNEMKASIRHALYFNFNLMLSHNQYLLHPNWKHHKIPILTRWINILEDMCEQHKEKPEGKEIYRAMLAILEVTSQKGIFEYDLPSYMRLVNLAIDRYVKIIKSIPIKSREFYNTLEGLSPAALFQIPSKKEEPLLKKAFAKLIASLSQIKHLKMQAFIKELQNSMK